MDTIINMIEAIRDTGLHFTEFGHALVALNEETARAIDGSLKERGFDCVAFQREAGITHIHEADSKEWCVRFSKTTDLQAAQDAVDRWNKSFIEAA